MSFKLGKWFSSSFTKSRVIRIEEKGSLPFLRINRAAIINDAIVGQLEVELSAETSDKCLRLLKDTLKLLETKDSQIKSKKAEYIN